RRERHHTARAPARPADVSFNVINQISLRVDSLGTLRELYLGLKEEPVEILGPISHGTPLAVSFRAPEGNGVELLIDTPWCVPQPHRVPVDIMQSDEQLWGGIEKICRRTPRF